MDQGVVVAAAFTIVAAVVALVVLARHGDSSLEHFWVELLLGRSVVPRLLDRLRLLDRAIAHFRSRAREERAAGEPARAARIDEACRSFEAHTRSERDELQRLRRVVESRQIP